MTTSSSAPLPLFYAEDAEKGVIGSVLMTEGIAFAALRERLTADDFWSRRHRLYWQIFERLADQGLAVDIAMVGDEMMRLSKDDLDLSGGPAYMAFLVNTTPTSWHAESYASKVLEMSIRRQAMEMLDATREALSNLVTDSRAVLAGADRALLRLRSLQGVQNMPTRDMDAFALNLFEMLLEAEKRTAANPEYVIGVRTGITDLDTLLDGLRVGVTTLAAATGVGKSAATLQVARFAAQYGLLHETVAPAKVLFFSGEMTERQLGTRMLSSMTGIPARSIERGSYNKAQKMQLADAVNDLSTLALTLVPGARLNTTQIRQIARKLVTNHELDLLVLDGLLQIEALKVHDSDSTRRQLYVKQLRRDLIEDIMNDLEDISLTYELPILMTHQLSRAPATRNNKRPILSDLAEASFVEQKSAVILFLYREGYYEETSPNPNAAEFIVAKNRFGSTGTIHQIYDAMQTRFVDADKVTWPLGGS